MKHTVSRELYEYWNRVRGDDRAPRRGAIEPADIRRILPDTFILEVGDRENFRVRLAGTRVCSLYCRELKNSNFFDLWARDDRSAMQTLGAAVTEDGAAAVVTVNAKTASGQEVPGELLLLPLINVGPNFDRVLGSLALLERPYWLGSEPAVEQTITSLRLVWPNQATAFNRRRTDQPQGQVGGQMGGQLQGLQPAARGRPVAFPLPNSRRRGHLFVLDGGKDH